MGSSPILAAKSKMKKVKELIEDFMVDPLHCTVIIASAMLMLILIGSFLFSLLKSFT